MWVRIWALAVLAGSGWLQGCGGTKPTLLGQAYQDTHAFFNGYYNARRQFREATKALRTNYTLPEEGFIPLLPPPPDTTQKAPAGVDLNNVLAQLPPSLGGPNPFAGGGGGVPPPTTGAGTFGNQGFQNTSNTGSLGSNTGYSPFQAGSALGSGSIPANQGAALLTNAPAPEPDLPPGFVNRPLLKTAAGKCEVVIFRRPMSKYVDDTWLLMGQCHFYRHELGRALKEFDYITAKYPKANQAGSAVLWQARVYYEYGDYGTVRLRLQKLLRTPSLDDQVKADASRLLASVYRQEGNLSQAAKTLDDAAAAEPTHNGRALVQLALGQLYEAQGAYRPAITAYRAAQKEARAAPLRLAAELALLELSLAQPRIGLPADEVDARLKKLLRNPRFEPYQPRLYYGQALRLAKEEKYAEALRAAQLSLQRGAQASPTRRTQTYLLAGKLCFEHLNQLPLAAAYYDSAATVMPPAYPDGPNLRLFGAALREYAQLNAQRLEADSLLKLSQLSPRALEERINEMLDAQEAAADQQAALAAQSQAGQLQPRATGRASTFYFDNPGAVAGGKADFIRQWGPRPNADGWRLASLTVGVAATEQEEEEQSQAPTAVTTRQSRSALRQQLLARVPRDTAQLARLKHQWTEASHGVAQVLGLQLGKWEEAIVIHEQLLNDYAGTEVAARAAFALHRLYYELSHGPKAILPIDDHRSEDYAQLLLSNYPRSDYARRLKASRSPDELVLEPADADLFFLALQALQEKKQYETMLSLLDFKLAQAQQGVDTSGLDIPRLLYLKGYVHGSQGQKDSLVMAYLQLTTSYPASAWARRAQLTLDIISGKEAPGFTGAKTRLGEEAPPVVAPGTTDLDPDGLKRFSTQRRNNEPIVALVRTPLLSGKELPLRQALDQFNQQQSLPYTLNVNVFNNHGFLLLYVSPFPDFGAADGYITRLQAFEPLRKQLQKPEEEIFYITAQNFRNAFSQRKFDDYVQWFRQARPLLKAQK